MPYTCCVPRCRGNYKSGPRVSVYGFPDESTRPELHKQWLHAIKRVNFKPNKNTKVCEKHFLESDFIHYSEAYDAKSGKTLKVRLSIPKLVADAVPSQFPDLPSYFSATSVVPRENPDSRRSRCEEAALQQAVSESVKEQEEYDRRRRFSSLEEMKSCLNFIDTDKWTVIQNYDSVVICSVVCTPVPKITHSVRVSSDLHVSVFLQGTQLYRLGGKSVPEKVSHIDEVSSVLNDLKSCLLEGSQEHVIDIIIDLLRKNVENDPVITFLVDQLSLFGKQHHARRHSADLLVFSSLFFSFSPRAYRFVRNSGCLILPCETTIKSLMLQSNINPMDEQFNSNFLSYARRKYLMLDDRDKTVSLLLDEIYLKKYMDYKGGNIIGNAHDSQQSAKSAHVFMINSVTSVHKDVVHILPVTNLNALVLHMWIRKLIVGLEEIGYKIISVVTDNNSINGAAMSKFVFPPSMQFLYPHPVDSTRPLFFVIDPVHLLKCIRNNWLNQTNDGKCMLYPKFNSSEESNVCTASLSTLKKLHAIELDSLVKYGYNLSFKALSPTNLERQNVKLVLQVFNDFVIKGLVEMGNRHDLPHCKETADYLQIILTWWQILNVKHPFTGKRLNNKYQTPLTNSPDDDKLIYLNKFMDWLDKWKLMNLSSGKLTRETHSALKRSTYAITELCSYCTTELGLQYILPGKFQTDNLESRFGMYRQLAGSQYLISLRQLYECETKLRLQSHLYLKLRSQQFGEIIIEKVHVESELEEPEVVLCEELNDVALEPDDWEGNEEVLPVLVYVAGYCAFSLLKRLKCELCREALLLPKELDFSDSYNFLRGVDRGALCYPKEIVVNAVVANYVVIQKLCSDFESQFLRTQNQRQTALSVTLNQLDLPLEEQCDNGHSMEKNIVSILWRSTNALLNNYCKTKNDKESSMAKRIQSKNVRKLQIMS